MFVWIVWVSKNWFGFYGKDIRMLMSVSRLVVIILWNVCFRVGCCECVCFCCGFWLNVVFDVFEEFLFVLFFCGCLGRNWWYRNWFEFYRKFESWCNLILLLEVCVLDCWFWWWNCKECVIFDVIFEWDEILCVCVKNYGYYSGGREGVKNWKWFNCDWLIMVRNVFWF